MKKKSSTTDVPKDNSGKGDDRFCRFEYWGIGPYFQSKDVRLYIVRLIMLKSPNIFQALQSMESCTEDLFPQPGTQVGYCGAEFYSEPPKDSLHGLTNRLQLDTNQRISFYERRGKQLIISAAFVNSKPLLPIDIQSLSSKEILNLEPF